MFRGCIRKGRGGAAALSLAGLMASYVFCAAGAADASPEGTPLFEHRTLYAPGHFGNGYEVMGENEMRAVLEEAKHWGFNRYSDWFDMADCADPFVDPHYNIGQALWDRKKTNFRTAQELGLAVDFLFTPNHVYLDQCLPKLRATKGKRIFGQLICPSIPEARAIILNNYDNLFADLAKAGVRLSSIVSCPYDYGGCACEQCDPWILTFAKLCRDIHAVAAQHHPGVEMHFVGWWWSEEEHRLFAEWCDREAPGWAKSISLHIPYGETKVSNVPLPDGCERRAFVHISYAEEASPRDTYGHLGPIIAADRLEQTLSSLHAQGCTGWMAYSEGVYEDANKAILAGLSSGAYATADAVLDAYVRRYLGADDANAADWAAWLEAWGKPFAVDADAAHRKLQELRKTAPTDTWRFRQWELKTDMVRAHTAIMASSEWTPERLAHVDRFWALQEALQRDVYGLGPQRHIFARRFTPLPWYKSWAEYTAAQVGKAEAEM